MLLPKKVVDIQPDAQPRCAASYPAMVPRIQRRCLLSTQENFGIAWLEAIRRLRRIDLCEYYGDPTLKVGLQGLTGSSWYRKWLLIVTFQGLDH